MLTCLFQAMAINIEQIFERDVAQLCGPTRLIVSRLRAAKMLRWRASTSLVSTSVLALCKGGRFLCLMTGNVAKRACSAGSRLVLRTTLDRSTGIPSLVQVTSHTFPTPPLAKAWRAFLPPTKALVCCGSKPRPAPTKTYGWRRTGLVELLKQGCSVFLPGCLAKR